MQYWKEDILKMIEGTPDAEPLRIGLGWVHWADADIHYLNDLLDETVEGGLSSST